MDFFSYLAGVGSVVALLLAGLVISFVKDGRTRQQLDDWKN